jgi:soluble lytic murein transglycosylase-like protein
LPQDCKSSVIALFGQTTDHSSIPAKTCTAFARSVGRGRPPGRRTSASPLMAASTVAALRSLRIVVWIVAILAASMLSSGSAHAERTSPHAHRGNGLSVDPLAAYVTESSRRFGVPERWIRAIMRVESQGKQRALSKKGAMGLMQIMPGTWTELRSRYRLGADPYDARDNILAGAAYIRQLRDRYGAPGFLAAYNAGPGRYEHHLATGRPLPQETQAYVAMLAPVIESKQADVQVGVIGKSFAWANSPLVAARHLGISREGGSSAGMHQNRSSGPLGVVDLSALVPHAGNLFVHRTGEKRSR